MKFVISHLISTALECKSKDCLILKCVSDVAKNGILNSESKYYITIPRNDLAMAWQGDKISLLGGPGGGVNLSQPPSRFSDAAIY